jgi:hypothetical protein
MEKEDIIKILQDWWDEEPENCSIENCDTCFNCYNKLCNKFGLKFDNCKVQEINGKT